MAGGLASPWPPLCGPPPLYLTVGPNALLQSGRLNARSFTLFCYPFVLSVRVEAGPSRALGEIYLGASCTSIWKNGNSSGWTLTSTSTARIHGTCKDTARKLKA